MAKNLVLKKIQVQISRTLTGAHFAVLWYHPKKDEVTVKSRIVRSQKKIYHFWQKNVFWQHGDFIIISFLPKNLEIVYFYLIEDFFVIWPKI